MERRPCLSLHDGMIEKLSYAGSVDNVGAV
jgi:hypothetical protein